MILELFLVSDILFYQWVDRYVTQTGGRWSEILVRQLTSNEKWTKKENYFPSAIAKEVGDGKKVVEGSFVV